MLSRPEGHLFVPEIIHLKCELKGAKVPHKPKAEEICEDDLVSVFTQVFSDWIYITIRDSTYTMLQRGAEPLEIVVRKSLATVLLGMCTLLILGVLDPLDCFYFLLQLNEYIFVHHYWVKSTATSVVGVVGLEATWCHRSAIEQRAARDSGLTGADQSTDAPDDSSHPAFNSHSIWANRPKPPTNSCCSLHEILSAQGFAQSFKF